MRAQKQTHALTEMSCINGKCESENHSFVSDSLQPHGLYSPWNSPSRNTGVGSLSLLQGNLPNPGMDPRSPALQTDCLPAETPGKPKNTRVGSLSLLQGIFPTQEWNQGLLHCRRILYQLSYVDSGARPEYGLSSCATQN